MWSFRCVTLIALGMWVCGIRGAGANEPELEVHPHQEPRVLNNFVTRLLRVENLAEDRTHVFTIERSRTGWLFFRVAAWAGRSGEVKVTLESADADDSTDIEVTTFSAGDKRTVEVMRHVVGGRYRVRVTLKDAELSFLDVRKIPIIIYERVPGGFRNMAGFPEYDRKWLERCGMLSSVNTIGTYDGFRWMGAWQKEGKHAIRIGGNIGGLKSEERAYQHWLSCMVNPGGNNGTIIDEIYPGLKERFPFFIKALKRLRKDMPDRVCYFYLAGGADELRPFVEPLKDRNFYFALEEQFYERRTLKEVEELGFAKRWVSGFTKYFPNFSEHCIHSVGVLSGPSDTKYNDDVFPSVDFKVLRDLHFYELATDPIHAGAAGVEIYQSVYCEEEYLRWCAKLFRHYAIEGSRERLSQDPYELTHIENPDFENALEGWTIEPAAPGSMEVRELKGYGFDVQGRHGHVGDHFLWTKRSTTKPNVISQDIKNLEPGRHYSIRMYTGDYQNLSTWQIHNVSVRLRGSEIDPSLSFQNAWEHKPNEKFGNKPTYPNYHRYVFKALAPTVKLIISDWHAPSVPSGPAGQELMFNFIQIQPFLMSD